MTIDLNSSSLVQTLLVGGLFWTARTLAGAVVGLNKVTVIVEQHEKRLDKLEGASQ